mgnify:CR=1 FL=1
MKKQSTFKMKGFSGFGDEESPVKQTIKYGEKSYTKKDPKKSYMGDKSRSRFKLYDAARYKDKFGHIYGFNHENKYSKTDFKRSERASKYGEAGIIGSTAMGLAGPGYGLGAIAALPAGLTATGAVIGEGTRRMRKGETRAKDRPASKFSGGKTWSQAKKEGKNKFKLKSGKNK